MKICNRHLLSTLMLATMSLSLSQVSQAQDDRDNPWVFSPHERFHGRTYAELGARWWVEGYSIPIINGDHPALSGGVFGWDRDLRFLVGGANPVINVTVPEDTALFVPITNQEGCNFDGFDSEDDELAFVDAFEDAVTDQSATIDGHSIRIGSKYRSTRYFEVVLPANNLESLPAGSDLEGYESGYYLLLKPLKKGKHVLHITGTYHFDGQDYPTDYTFNITVKRDHDR